MTQRTHTSIKQTQSEFSRASAKVVGGQHAPKLVCAPEHIGAHAEIHDETGDGRSLRSTCEKPICLRHGDVCERSKLAAVQYPLATQRGDLFHARCILEARLLWHSNCGSETRRASIGAVGGISRDDCDVRREDTTPSIVIGAGTRRLGATRGTCLGGEGV